MEKETPNQTGFCSCFHNYYEAAIDSVYDDKPFPDTELPEGDFCDKCRKPVNPIDTRTIETIIEMYGEVENEH